MYNPKSMVAEEFISHEEILETLEYAEKHKTDAELIQQKGLYADFVHVRAKANSWKLEA